MSVETKIKPRRMMNSRSLLAPGIKLRVYAFAEQHLSRTAILAGLALPVMEDLRPVQSAGQSEPSMRMDSYIRAALAGISELSPESSSRIRITSSPQVKAANMDPWAAKNGRRIRLIEKKHKEGLTPTESADLARLKQEVSDHMQVVAPRSTEVIDEIASRIDKLRERITAKREKKA